MSIDSDLIICSNCSFNRLITYSRILLTYDIGNNTFHTHPKYGWCYQCDTISHIEPEFNINEIESELKIVEAKLAEKKSFLSKLFRSKELIEIESKTHQLKLHLEIATTRESPPRCLWCGGKKTKEIASFEGKFFKHKCGGFLAVASEAENENSIRFSYALEEISLDKEGIRKDKSSYPNQ